MNNDSGEHQETSSSTSSLTDCPSDNAEDKSVQNANESETWAASDQPSTSGKKKMKSDRIVSKNLAER